MPNNAILFFNYPFVKAMEDFCAPHHGLAASADDEGSDETADEGPDQTPDGTADEMVQFLVAGETYISGFQLGNKVHRCVHVW